MLSHSRRFAGLHPYPKEPETVSDVLRLITGVNQDHHSLELGDHPDRPDMEKVILDLIALVERDSNVAHILFASPETPISSEARRLGRRLDSYWLSLHGE